MGQRHGVAPSVTVRMIVGDTTMALTTASLRARRRLAAEPMTTLATRSPGKALELALGILLRRGPYMQLAIRDPRLPPMPLHHGVAALEVSW